MHRTPESPAKILQQSQSIHDKFLVSPLHTAEQTTSKHISTLTAIRPLDLLNARLYKPPECTKRLQNNPEAPTQAASGTGTLLF